MLKFIGDGSAYLPGVPARDLSDEEVEEHGGEERLLASGLYERPPRERKPRREAPETPGGGE